MNLKGSKTEKNLQAAFAGESQARNKYTFFASQAKKDGYQQIGAIFEETAGNEKEHAKIWYKILNGGGMGSTEENLKIAAEGEHGEWTSMYKGFAEEAKEHDERYQKLLKALQNNTVFEKDGEVYWKCRNCGYIYKGKFPPEVCPVCSHPKSFFELKAENY